MGSCLSSDGRNSLPPSSGGRKQRKPMKKKPGIRSPSSFDSNREDQLHRISGRMFLNGASKVASLFTQQGRKGMNQDAMIVWENFGSRTDTVFCGIFDGHGPFGHMVARRVRDDLPLKLSAHWEVNIGSDNGLKENSSTAGSMNSEETSSICMDEEPMISMDLEEREKHPDIFFTLRQSFLKAFRVMDKELRLHPNIDCFCSGTTAVTLVKQGQDLIIGNIGDSRAILGTRDQDNSLIAVQLTEDLKPNLPSLHANSRSRLTHVYDLEHAYETLLYIDYSCKSSAFRKVFSLAEHVYRYKSKRPKNPISQHDLEPVGFPTYLSQPSPIPDSPAKPKASHVTFPAPFPEPCPEPMTFTTVPLPVPLP